MSDDTQAQLDRALSRIAALEAQRAQAAQPSGVNLDQFRQAMAIDPAGTLRKMGVPLEHVTNVLVAAGLGDKAEPGMKALAALGPTVSAQMAIQSDVQSVRQRLDQIETESKRRTAQQEFQQLASNKSKYPALSAAYAADPSAFDDDVGSLVGNPADLAARMERKLVAASKANTNTQTDSAAHSGAAAGQSKQADLAKQGSGNGAGGVDTTPPRETAKAPVGVFTPADHEDLKARVLKKYGRTA